MKITESCGCGASLSIEVELIADPRDELQRSQNAIIERDAWKKIERWRRQHVHETAHEATDA